MNVRLRRPGLGESAGKSRGYLLQRVLINCVRKETNGGVMRLPDE